MSDRYGRFDPIADELIRKGVVEIDIDFDVNLINEIQLLYKKFVARRNELDDWEQWGYRLADESENDVGLIRPRPGKDLKYYFHDNAYFRKCLADKKSNLLPGDLEFLQLNQRLFNYVDDLGKNISQALLIKLGKTNLIKDCWKCSEEFVSYCLTTLRGLFYPDDKKQKGAKGHYDRSFISIHLGDIGGTLLALKNLRDKNGRDISPGIGKATIFLGVKAFIISEGLLKPLCHASVTEPGKDRLAYVHFVHIPIVGHVVKDALESLRAFHQKFFNKPLVE